ncbi:Retrovirus-related Pol polyprotein from type-1 retrotransposable element R2 [Stylophora pistillata]|uniref:Retrovirus-related Pol polyprotein from type-1 retrotransposable element R2 n=1 Tax=Stylophora pistillata TaxID=50429 RepID=A0A2B4SK65_STYPI|nr:Retrovirus-related Pol polyprotein from type-1 retrotransposable element R2 [Stylophora pistillata]
MEATRVLARKKNWSAPGPDRLTNVWWKKALVLHEDVAMSFQAIANTNEEYPPWFSEGKTTLLPKPGKFTSDNQRPITCLNTPYKWFTSCLLGPANQHLETHGLMDGAQRGARAGCCGTIDNLMIDRVVTLDCHSRKRNLSMAWIDVKKAYDSVDHGWLEEMKSLHRLPIWLSRTVEKLRKSWNTRVVATTKLGREKSEPIKFLKGLPQDDALCPRLFTVCLNPIAWKISASEGYKLSKPISVKVTDLLYIDDLKVFASSESKLSRVMESTKTAWRMSDSNGTPKKGNQHKFLGVLETVRQEERMSLEGAVKEYLRRMSFIWSSPLFDYNRVTASNKFALPTLGYLMWTQQWPVTELKKVDREARKIIVENGGKHPSGSTAILYLPREKGGRGLRSIEEEYKVTRIKVAVKLYSNSDPAMAMVREFEEREEELGHSSLVKEATRYADETGLQLQLEYPSPACIKRDSGEVVTAKKLKVELRRVLEEKTWETVHEQNWQGKLLSARTEDESLNFNGCYWWLSSWKQCPTHTVAGMFELYEQLLPTRLYACRKTHTDTTVETVPPWYSSLKPKPAYEANNAQAFWDVP